MGNAGLKAQITTAVDTESDLPGLDVKALIVIVVICTSWGLNHPLTKMAYVDISPVLAAAIRSLLAPIGLLIYCFIKKVSLKMGPGGQFHAVMLGLIYGFPGHSRPNPVLSTGILPSGASGRFG